MAWIKSIATRYCFKSTAIGEKCLTLSEFEWDSDTNTLIYGQTDYPYGTVLSKPDIDEGNVIRLYSKDEINWIFSDLKMTVRKTYSDFDGNPSSENKIQLIDIFGKAKILELFIKKRHCYGIYIKWIHIPHKQNRWRNEKNWWGVARYCKRQAADFVWQRT